MLIMVFANNSGGRIGRSHWEESFRKHCRDDVFVCSRCRSDYVHSTSKQETEVPWRDVPGYQSMVSV